MLSPQEIVVRIYANFYKNFGIKNDFTKYLKERCGKCSDEHSYLKHVYEICFFLCNITKDSRLHHAATVRINGLTDDSFHEAVAYNIMNEMY